MHFVSYTLFYVYLNITRTLCTFSHLEISHKRIRIGNLLMMYIFWKVADDTIDNVRFRNGIVASSFLQRKRAGSEAQTLGSSTRWRHVHLWGYDRPTREKRLLAMGCEDRFLVSVEEQTRTRTSTWTRSLQASQLYANIRWRKRWFSYERTMEVSFR